MAEKKKVRLDVLGLREELIKVAEKEARKRPDISKEELKKKLADHVTKARIAEAALTPGLKKIVEHIIGITAEMAIKMVEILLREKKEFEKLKEEKAAKKPAPAVKAKPKAKPKKKR